VLIGDQKQLPPTILSHACRLLERHSGLHLGESLFQRLVREGCPATMLEVQYRMHPAIAEFPARKW
jgi:superfamily I DNA and/or RNA helicase